MRSIEYGEPTATHITVLRAIVDRISKHPAEAMQAYSPKRSCDLLRQVPLHTLRLVCHQSYPIGRRACVWTSDTGRSGGGRAQWRWGTPGRVSFDHSSSAAAFVAGCARALPEGVAPPQAKAKALVN